MNSSILARALFAVVLVLGAAGLVQAADSDGDGYDALAGDCNDSDPTIHPGAVERVGDGIDQDCDGHEICYADNDNDGARKASTIVSTDIDCVDAFEATESDPLDCDDTNASVHPGAAEVCDAGNTDEDCDGTADDADPDGAVGKSNWYADADGDGYGAGAATLRCDGSAGFAATGDDCDDTDAAVHPGAAEVVGDGRDDDCDGFEICYTDSDNDGARTSSTVFSADTDCDDAFEATAADPLDCDDGNAAVHPTAAEVCDAGDTDEDCDGTADDADPDALGKTSWYADADGDGFGAGAAMLRCDGSAGLAASGGDCDDADPATHPDAAEVCTDGADNDCDTVADCADASCGSDSACSVTVFDHLECFKIKTTEKMKGTVTLDPGTNPPFALAAGCTIGKATKYCVPVTKTVSALETTLTPDPAYVGQELTDSRICYKVKCPDASVPPTIDVHDQFGTRTFEKLRVTEVCTPAAQAP